MCAHVDAFRGLNILHLESISCLKQCASVCVCVCVCVSESEERLCACFLGGIIVI